MMERIKYLCPNCGDSLIDAKREAAIRSRSKQRKTSTDLQSKGTISLGATK